MLVLEIRPPADLCQLTFESGSCARHASSTASDTCTACEGGFERAQTTDAAHLAPTDLGPARTWSQSLSGCPSFTDSEVKRKVSCVMVDLPD